MTGHWAQMAASVQFDNGKLELGELKEKNLGIGEGNGTVGIGDMGKGERGKTSDIGEGVKVGDLKKGTLSKKVTSVETS